MTRVDYCVTTMDRPQALERLLVSVAKRYPDASIHVADQSGEVGLASYEGLSKRLKAAGLRERPTIHSLPFDCGVSAARNHLMESTPGEYKLILDDDFVFTERTDIGSLVQLMDAHPEAGLVGGSVVRNGQVRNVGTLLRQRGDELCQLAADDRPDEHEGIRFKRADCVPMFALMRGDVLGEVRWDPALKTAGEHFDFFLRLRTTSYTVLYAPDVAVDHPLTTATDDYARRRWRPEFMERVLSKHGIARLRTLDGVVLELGPEGRLVRYRDASEAPLK